MSIIPTDSETRSDYSRHFFGEGSASILFTEATANI